MAVFKKDIKVLLYGDMHGAYRCENLIKVLLDSGYCVSHVHPEFYLKRGVKQTPLTRLLNKVASKFQLIEFFSKAILADVIYIMPVNTRLIKRAILATKWFGGKIIWEIYDTMSTHFEGEQKLKEVNLQDIENEKIALLNSDYIIHISQTEIEYWQNEFGTTIDKNKIYIAPIFSESKLTHSRKFMQDCILKICWWGSFLPAHGIDNVLKAIQILKQKDMPFSCNFFGAKGPGYDKRFQEYENKIKEMGLEQIISLRSDLKFADNSLPEYLVNNCDLALGMFGNISRSQTIIGNKVIESLMMGLPTLTMKSLALEEFFNSELDLWTCQPSPESIAEAIISIVNGTVYQVNWEQTRQKVSTTFSVTRYREVLNQVLNRVEEDLKQSS
jgi:glycosyltransferase involved in cell wall biosynthesis